MKLMKLIIKKRSSTLKFTVFNILIAFLLILNPCKAITYNVTTTADAGAGSLRQAILTANGTVGVNDIIDFSMLGAGIFTINLISDLPNITDRVLIDGFTAVSYTANNPKIEIKGQSRVFLVNNTAANGSIIQGIIMNRCTVSGVELNGVSNITVRGCWIGLSNTGGAPTTIADSISADCLFITNSSSNNLIGGSAIGDRNVIGCGKSSGIQINATSTLTRIEGCYVGLGPDGMTNRGNKFWGIRIDNANNTTIGGTTISKRNIVCGNKINGIYVIGGSAGTIIKANFVGIAKDGITAIPNVDHGIWVNGAGTTTVGGNTFQERNVISGNGKGAGLGNGNGLSFDGSNNNVVKGNWCGVDSTGLIAVPNTQGGISFWNCDLNTIGGSTQYERNIFSGNVNEGLFMGGGSDDNSIIGNYIGVGADGIIAIGNQKFGLNLFPDTRNTTVGGSLANANIIANNGFIDPGTGNTGPGISLDGGNSTKNMMTFNKIYCNAGLAIKITGGANNGIPAPAITTSTASTVSGTGATNNIIHIYRNGNFGGPGCDCEAEIYVGSTTVTAGSWSFTHSLGLTTGAGGQASYVTATQTDLNAPVPNTSALAPCNTTPILPVDLLYFNVAKINNLVEIEWQTASELNNDYFIVERSSDGVHFEEIGKVNGHGTTNIVMSYNFSDHNPLNGINYYRITQVDYNKTKSSTEIKSINNYYTQILILPNPTSGLFSLNFIKADKETYQIRIFNTLGQEVYNSIVGDNSNSNSISKEIDIAAYEAGIYLIRVESSSTILISKIEKF